MFGKRKKKEYSDLELIAEYKRSDETYYVGILFQRYTHLVTALALKYTNNTAVAEDAVMEVFEILIGDLKKHEVKNFKAWLYSVTKNHCLKKKRQLQKERAIENEWTKNGDAVMEFDSETDLTNEALLKNAQLDNLEEAIKMLKDEQRVCVELFYLKDKSYQDVSDITGYSLKQVKSHIQNGKRKLKGFLTELNERE